MYSSIPGITITGSSTSGIGSVLTTVSTATRGNSTAVVLGSVVSSSYSVTSSFAVSGGSGGGGGGTTLTTGSSYPITSSVALSGKELLDGANRIYKNGDAFNVVGDFNVDPTDTFTVNLNNPNSSAGINSIGEGNTIGLYNLGANGLILIQNDSGADNSTINIENTATNGLLNIENQGAGGVINIANASGKIDILASTVNINAAKVTGSLLGTASYANLSKELRNSASYFSLTPGNALLGTDGPLTANVGGGFSLDAVGDITLGSQTGIVSVNTNRNETGFGVYNNGNASGFGVENFGSQSTFSVSNHGVSSSIYFGNQGAASTIELSNWLGTTYITSAETRITNAKATGSLFGSASYALTASYSLNGGGGGGGTSLSTGSSYPITSSWSESASYAPNIGYSIITYPHSSMSLDMSYNKDYIRLTHATSCSITVQSQSVVSWTDDVDMVFRVAGAGFPAIITASTVTVNGGSTARTLQQNNTFVLKRVSQDTWDFI